MVKNVPGFQIALPDQRKLSYLYSRANEEAFFAPESKPYSSDTCNESLEFCPLDPRKVSV